MNIGLSLSYVFNDREWFKKLAIPGLCLLIPIIGPFIVTGWGMQATKNVIDGKVENALPNLDFGGDLVRGLIATLITIVYGLPIAIIGLIAGLLFSFEIGSGDTIGWLPAISTLCIALIVFILGVILTFLREAGVANYLAKGKLGAAFKFKEVFGLIKKSFVSWLILIVGKFIALDIIGPLGTIVCFVGIVLTLPFGTAVYSHLLGQAYNKSATPAFDTINVL